MPPLSLLCTLLSLLKDQVKGIRREDGSVSVEQVLIAVGLVAAAAAAVVAIQRAVANYSRGI